MHRRWSVVVALVICFLCSSGLSARAQSADPAGLTTGDYLRVSAGQIAPVHPAGNLRDWTNGVAENVSWETWQGGSSGVGLVGFSVGFDYATLPLNEPVFIANTSTVNGEPITAAHASDASLWALSTMVRVRMPMPIIMPSLEAGFGFLNYHPGTIHYTTSAGTAQAVSHSRSGPELSIGGGLDLPIYQRWALFAEALYTYGFTNISEQLESPGGICTANGCDVLKNTTIGTVRGGLRVRLGQ